MSKKTLFLIVKIIKCYQFLISPILGNRCRYLPTCSDYFIEALKIHGILKGAYLGFNLLAHFKTFNFPVVFTRAANIYGPYQQSYRIVPKIIISILTCF